MEALDQAHQLVFSLRLLIAKAGEKDGLGWWDSDALSEAGQFVLKRLFPRSYRWAGAELALEAATMRHHRILESRRDVLSLFSMGEAVERAMGAYLRRLRRSGVDAPSLPPLSTIQALTDLLRERGGIDSADLQAPDAQRMFALQSVEIGRLTRRQATISDEVTRAARRLAAAYTLGEPGTLLVPYVRLTG